MPKNLLTFAFSLLVAVAAGTPLSAAACGSLPYIGEICSFGNNFCPRGFAAAAGQLLPISQYDALFSLIGTTYGGDGINSFALPDLSGRSGVGTGTGQILSEVRLGEEGGAEQVVLNSNHLPPHTHQATTDVTVDVAVNAVSGRGSSNSPSGKLSAASTSRDNLYSTGSQSTAMAANAVQLTATATTTIGTAGAGQPAYTRSPYLGVTYCIALEGIYPVRN